MRRIHPITYQLARHDRARPVKLHMRRDLCAIVELEAALYDLGYRHGEPIFNQPSRVKPPPGGLSEMDLSFVQPDDLLLQCMRPPIHDIAAGAKRKIARAYTTLEERHFLCARIYLEYCARPHMRLDPALQGLIKADYEDRREMSFGQKGWGAPYSELNALAGHGWRKYCGNRRTALFLMHFAHAWKGGPGYLCAFGMDGCTTAIWAYRLARDFKHLLGKPGFVMAELELGKMPEHVTGLQFCQDWKIEPLLVYEHQSDDDPRIVAPAPALARRAVMRVQRKPVLVPQA